jgi:hypothetical protein
VTERHFTIIPLERVIALRPDHLMLRAANLFLKAVTTLAPGLFGYQVVLVAEKR